MVFRREGERLRYFFVQYEAKIPVYEYRHKKWRVVPIERYFVAAGNNGLAKKEKANYAIVITEPIGLDEAVVDGVRHQWCQSGICSGLNSVQAEKRLAVIAEDELRRWLIGNEEYRGLVSRFRVLAGRTCTEFELPDPDDWGQYT